MTLSVLPTRTPAASRGSAAPLAEGLRPLPYWLSGGLALLLVVASAAGLFIPGLYRDSPDWVAQTRATDLVTLVVAVPALLAALVLAARGSLRAQVVWLGVVGHILYMYVIYAFDVAFNPLFLVYVAALSLAVWSLVALLVRIDPRAVGARHGPGLPVRTISLYLIGVAALFALTWLKDIVPAIMGNTTPASLARTAQVTNPVEVLDLSLFLPFAVLSGIWLWQQRPWGDVLAGMALTTMTLVGLSVIVDMVFERLADPTVSLSMAPVFAVVTLVGLGLLVRYLRTLLPGPRSTSAVIAQARKPGTHRVRTP